MSDEPTSAGASDAVPEIVGVDARIAELAAGFAMGELGESELREFYDHLRDPGERGAAAARLAWEQLGVVTDLRASLGSGFQEAIRHRVSREGLSDRFVRDARKRLGAVVPALSEVAAPETRPRLRAAPLVAALLLVVVAIVVAALWVSHQRAAAETLCRVSAVAGEAGLGGQPLVPGMSVDHRQIAVPAGSQVALNWPDGSLVVIAGPANAVAQQGGLSLIGGAAWIAAESAFTCGLPDDTVRIDAGARVAAEVRGARSSVGVARGAAALSARSLSAGDAATNAVAFPWTSCELADAPARTAPAPEWTLEASVAWREAADTVPLAVVDEAVQSGWTLSWRPGEVVALRLGAADVEGRRVALPGPPLGEARLALIASRGRLSVGGSGGTLFEEAAPPSTSVVIGDQARARLLSLRFHTGPPRKPPLPVADEKWATVWP
jgi:hypothetical protein